MRFLVLSVALAVAATPAVASGAYTSAPAANAANCIKLCNDDSLCVGSTFSAGACHLWASVPLEAPQSFALSNHAPDFARAMAATAPPPSPSPERHANSARQTSATAVLLGGPDSPDEGLRPRMGDGN